MNSRDEKGQFLPGRSGNPGGRPAGLAALIRERTAEGVELVDFMLKVFRGQVKGVKPQNRIEAAGWLAERGWGKAVSQVEIYSQESLTTTSIDEKLAQLTVEDLRALAGEAREPGSNMVIEGEGRVVGDN